MIWSQSRVDDKNRISIGTPVRRVGWQVGDELNVRVAPGRITLTQAAENDASGRPASCIVTIDRQRRVILNAAAMHALAMRPRGQVLMFAEEAPPAIVVVTHPSMSYWADSASQSDATADDARPGEADGGPS